VQVELVQKVIPVTLEQLERPILAMAVVVVVIHLVVVEQVEQVALVLLF
jgi:hypothetical protein